MAAIKNKQFLGTEEDELVAIKSWLLSVSPAEGSIDVSKHSSNGIMIMTINNPAKRNALTGKMMCQMNDHLNQITSCSNNNGDMNFPLKVLLLHGASGFFCSGLDLKLVQKMLDDRSKAEGMSKLMRQNMDLLANLPSVITIAMIDGKALGGGAEIAASCHYRIMTPNAEIAFVHIKMGITMAFGGGVRFLLSTFPRDRALKVLLSGDRFGADSCVEWGICKYILVSSTDQERLGEALDWIESTFC